MNKRTELIAFQMVNNRGFKTALEDVRKNIDLYKECVNDKIDVANIRALNFLNNIESEILKLKKR